MHFRYFMILFLAALSWMLCADYTGSQPLRTQDLAGSGTDILIKGGVKDGKAGYSVAMGDVNGDGIDDLLVGAPFVNAPGGAQAGAVYVFYGKKTFPGNYTLDLAKTPPDVTLLGDDKGDFLGACVATGDFNGDGTLDIVASAWGVDHQNRGECGGVYVIHGGASISSLIDLDKIPADLTVYGRDFFIEMGRSLALGDINRDGIDDIFMGAPDADPTSSRGNAGEAYVLFGKKTYPAKAVVDFLGRAADITLQGRYQFNHLGSSIASGDFNNDGIDDLVVGAKFASANLVKAGETYVLYGRSTWNTPFYLDLGSAGRADFTVIGRYSNDNLSTSLAVGDVNGDGRNDLLTTAHGASPGHPKVRNHAGEANVILGRAYSAYHTWDLGKTPPDVRILGRIAGDRLGQGGTLADMDGDGVKDIIVAASEASPSSRSNAGQVFVVRGGTALPSVIDLDKVSTDWEILGAVQNERTGQFATAAGDLNADGHPDLALGIPTADFNTLTSAGGVRVLFGGFTHALDPPRVGTSMRIKITAPAYPNTFRLGAAAFSGLLGLPIDTRIFPLDPDVLFFTSLSATTVFKDYAGFIDKNGEATATLVIPGISALAGYTIYSAFVLLDTGAPSGTAAVGNRLHITFQP